MKLSDVSVLVADQLYGQHVRVEGVDFEPYSATIVGVINKLNGKQRIVVEDRGRLFIQRPDQLHILDMSEEPT